MAQFPTAFSLCWALPVQPQLLSVLSATTSLGTSGVALSCSTQANGVYIDVRGNGAHTSQVHNNTIRQCFDRGILSEAGDGNPVLNP